MIYGDNKYSEMIKIGTLIYEWSCSDSNQGCQLPITVDWIWGRVVLHKNMIYAAVFEYIVDFVWSIGTCLIVIKWVWNS